MAYSIEKIDVWMGPIADVPGGAAGILAPLADAGANLEFVFARRDKHNKGVVFVAPVKGTGQINAAKKAGLAKSASVQAVRVAGPDKRGIGAAITGALGEAGINMRGLSAVAVGRKSVCYVALDSKKDTTKAVRILKKALAGR